MRFSLRTLLIMFVIVGLALSTILSTWKLQQTESEVVRVKAKYGVGGPNRYEMEFIGDPRGEIGDGSRSHIVRMDAPEDFKLKIISYDGFTQQSTIETTQLTTEDLVFAVTLNYQINVIEFHFASCSSQHWYHRTFQPSAAPWKPAARRSNRRVIHNPPLGMPNTTPRERGFLYPFSAKKTIDESPFLIYVFCPPEIDHSPFHWIDRDEIKLKAWCDKYQAQSVYFKFERVAK